MQWPWHKYNLHLGHLPVVGSRDLTGLMHIDERDIKVIPLFVLLNPGIKFPIPTFAGVAALRNKSG